MEVSLNSFYLVKIDWNEFYLHNVKYVSFQSIILHFLSIHLEKHNVYVRNICTQACTRTHTEKHTYTNTYITERERNLSSQETRFYLSDQYLSHRVNICCKTLLSGIASWQPGRFTQKLCFTLPMPTHYGEKKKKWKFVYQCYSLSTNVTHWFPYPHQNVILAALPIKDILIFLWPHFRNFFYVC